MSPFVSSAPAGAVSVSPAFAQLGLCEPLLKAIAREGYAQPTPIQTAAVPHVLRGSDLLGCAQTGTGKTAAFALPILHRLSQAASQSKPRPIRALVLTPTRELALQIHESFKTYGHFCNAWYAVIFGGVNQNPQVRALKNGVDVVIATPGRLLDLMNQGHVDLRNVQHLVLDEADNMLDMGFIHDIRKIIARLPQKRQTLLFSATMPTEIRALADAILHQPQHVQVAPVATPVEKIAQSVCFVEKPQKPAMLAHYLNHHAIERALVFTRTKHGADRVVKTLVRLGIHAQAIHGNKSQNARQRALAAFKSDAPPILVATDIAARGLDIDNVSHVINYEVPNVPETYVHRIGRTARAGASGEAVCFCDREERTFLRDIEKLIRRSIPVVETPPTLAAAGAVAVQHHPVPERRAADRSPMRHNVPTPRATLAGYGEDHRQPTRSGQPKQHPHAVKHPHAPRPPVNAGHSARGTPQPQGTAHKHKVGGGVVRQQNRPAHPLAVGGQPQHGQQHYGGFGRNPSGSNSHGSRRHRRR